jgi:hypothetical protein
VLDYKNRVKIFQLGMRVIGNISGATGTIIELVSGDSYQRMTLYPASGVFTDSESLQVGGVNYAQADGRSVDIPYTPYYQTIGPEDWVRSVLGGANWMRVSGIEPFKLVSSSGYWDTVNCPAVPFMFASKEKKFEAIKRLAKYMRYIFLVKFRDIGGGIYVSSAYWVKESEIDDPTNGLDLPAAATITGPDDPYLAAPITLDQNGENQVDRVKVCCQDLSGNWLTAIRTNSWIDSGEGPFREFYDEPDDIAVQSDLDAYADDMYDLYVARACTWTATLVGRSDLELYQLLTISGFGIEIPNGTYRIIKIAYEYGAAKNLVHITFMLSSAFSTLLRYGITYTDSISEIQRIIKHQEEQKPQTELGISTATDGWTVTYDTEAGNKGKGRDGTSTPSKAGSIPAGARIQIQSIRGGVVCLPIVAASGSSTDLLVVDVPTGVIAEVDPADANYWFLTWTPGANNANVSVNYQTTGYPSAHGVVLPYGNPASCMTKLYSIATRRIRIRFSGPLTTYYIKLWGEKNGIYSATGATATITSGAGVTVADPQEPEPIGVIDQFLCGGMWGTSDATVERTVFDGNLPISYNGTDNIYIGGPVEDDTPSTPHWDYTYPGPRRFLVDNSLRIRGPKGDINCGFGSGWGWSAPVNIKNILNVGTNHVTITLFDYGVIWGVSSLYIRTYYL